MDGVFLYGTSESGNTILIRGVFDVCRSRLLMVKEPLMASYQSRVAVIHSCWQVALGTKCSSITTCKPITPGVRKVQANNTKLKLLVLKFSVLPCSRSSGWVGRGEQETWNIYVCLLTASFSWFIFSRPWWGGGDMTPLASLDPPLNPCESFCRFSANV